MGTQNLEMGFWPLSSQHCHKDSSELSLRESGVRQHIWTPTKQGVHPR